ncbi:SGNH/GDSL hydrolase family protein [Candidatus Daviesbacteria bacterium]|nr:SGNH/GDSL hydrolase family protein [Candidatus Daviesbacteria bacterium]
MDSQVNDDSSQTVNPAKKVLLVILGILLAVVIGELSLRFIYFLADRQILGLHPLKNTIGWQDDKRIGRRLLPNQQGWFVTPTQEYYTWVTVNSQGWRDSEHQFNKEDKVFRIILIGDSFVENFQVPLAETFFKIVEKEINLANPGPKVEIIALGLGDTGTAQQLQIIEKYASLYQPDLVVQLFYMGNDVKNNSAKLQGDPHRLYFKLQDGQLQVIPFTTRSSLLPQRLLSFVKNNSNLVEWLLDQKGRIFTKIDAYPIDYQVYSISYSDEFQQAWEVTKALIKEARNQVANQGADYWLVAIPAQEQVDRQFWQDAISFYPKVQKADFDLAKPDKILKEFCSQENLSCLFTADIFKEKFAQNNQRLFYKQDGHWNSSGSRLMADILISNLKDYFSSR